MTAEKGKLDLLITSHFFLLLLGNSFSSRNTGAAVAHETVEGSQVLFYASISSLFKLLSKFQLSYLHFVAQVIWRAVQVPHRWWVWSLNMCFSNPDGVISAVNCLTSDFKRTLISPSGQGGFHSQCEVLAFFVPCKSDSGKYSPRGLGGGVGGLNLIPSVCSNWILYSRFILSSFEFTYWKSSKACKNIIEK